MTRKLSIRSLCHCAERGSNGSFKHTRRGKCVRFWYYKQGLPGRKSTLACRNHVKNYESSAFWLRKKPL
jgi:hypothetical protein